MSPPYAPASSQLDRAKWLGLGISLWAGMTCTAAREEHENLAYDLSVSSFSAVKETPGFRWPAQDGEPKSVGPWITVEETPSATELS